MLNKYKMIRGVFSVSETSMLINTRILIMGKNRPLIYLI